MGKIEDIKKKVAGDGLYINRVPKKVRTDFIGWAKEEFAGDYGMALKWLMDFKAGLLSSPNQLLADQIEAMAAEIEQLKSKPQTEQKEHKAIRSVSGKIIAGGK